MWMSEQTFSDIYFLKGGKNNEEKKNPTKILSVQKNLVFFVIGLQEQNIIFPNIKWKFFLFFRL